MSKLLQYKKNLYESAKLFESENMYLTGIVHGLTGLRVVVAVWDKEPEGDLPLGVLWLFTKPNDPRHLKLYKRISVTSTPPYQNTWEEITEYDDIWQMQEYIAPPAPISFDIATVPSQGLSLLSYPSENSIAKVIINSDPRLSNRRKPTDHKHPEKPATMLATESGHVTFEGIEESNTVLRSHDNDSFSYTKIDFSTVEGRPQ
jgi:hypothetical protein